MLMLESIKGIAWIVLPREKENLRTQNYLRLKRKKTSLNASLSVVPFSNHLKFGVITKLTTELSLSLFIAYKAFSLQKRWCLMLESIKGIAGIVLSGEKKKFRARNYLRLKREKNPTLQYGLFILVMCIPFIHISSPLDFVKWKKLVARKLLFPGKIKKVLFCAKVRSLDQRAKNAPDQSEQTLCSIHSVLAHLGIQFCAVKFEKEN